MSGDSFKPEEGGEHIEVINPDEGNTEIDAQPEPGDAMDAAESDALKAFEDTSNEEETTEEEVEPELVAEDQQAEEDQAEPETQDEVEPESSKPTWDGNPDNLPEELRDTYQSMLRGFHQKTREVADERRRLQELTAELQLRKDGGGSAEAKAPEGPPAMPTGPDTTYEDIAKWSADLSAYYAKTTRESVLKEIEDSGKFVPAEQFAKTEQERYNAEVVAEIQAMPGFTPEVENLMVEKMANNPLWAQAPSSKEGMRELAKVAIAEVGQVQATQAAATKAEAKIQKKVTAVSRATPRPSSPKAATPEDVFAKEGFKSENDRMAHAEQIALQELGGN